MRSDSADSTSLNLPRRTVLGAGAAVSAGLAAALAAGLGASQPSQSAPAPSGRRRFEGKVVAITGATSGIGRAAAIQFAAEGGKVAFCGRREALGGEVVQQIKDHGGEATYIRADVRNEAEVKNFIDRTVATYGRLDVAFNNAGITLEKPLHEYSSREWDDVTNTNLRGVFLAMKYLVGLVQSAALDYAQHSIRVNALLPGTTDTALVRRVAGMESVPDAVWELALRYWAKSHVPGLQRVAKPEEIAAFALVLASDEHPYLTGSQMVIDGGKTAHGG